MGLPLDVVYRGLAHLHGAGVPWPQAIEQATGRRDPRWWAAASAVSGGASLATALGPLVPPLDLAGLRAAEASGRFEEVFLALAQRHEDRARAQRERFAAVAYPIVLAHVGALLLPIPDLAMGRPGPAVLWALAVLVPVYAFLLVQRATRKAAERGEAPGFAPWQRWFLTKAAVEEADARALSALGWLHDAGVPPLEALPLAASAGAGGRAAADLSDGLEAAKRGHPIAEGWRRLPAEFSTALANGEASGRLSDACRHAAATLESTAALRRARALALLKPLSVLALGLVIGARVLAFYAGMWKQVGRL